jgi:hypothetical protein
MRIYSTWGDLHYVGLTGIELFDETGRLVTFPNRKVCGNARASAACAFTTLAPLNAVVSLVCVHQLAITADPPDINVLPEYGSDPRTVDNLLDGVNWTCDDMHVWLAPFTPGMVLIHTASCSRFSGSARIEVLLVCCRSAWLAAHACVSTPTCLLLVGH